MKTIEARLKRRRDPWAGYWTTKQRLSAAALKALAAL